MIAILKSVLQRLGLRIDKQDANIENFNREINRKLDREVSAMRSMVSCCSITSNAVASLNVTLENYKATSEAEIELRKLQNDNQKVEIDKLRSKSSLMNAKQVSGFLHWNN